MKEFINRWMARNAQCDGVIACGLRHPDQTTFNQPLASGLTGDSLDASWDCLAETFSFLRQKQADATRLCLSFGPYRIYAARRDDDTCLGVLTNPRQGEPDATTLEKMLSEFRSLRCPVKK